MNVNLAFKQKLLDKIEFLSEDQISNFLQFVDSLANLRNNSEPQKQEDNFQSSPNQETNFDVTYKAWQPCNAYDAIEKLTNRLFRHSGGKC
jgi:hypothetical protein